MRGQSLVMRELKLYLGKIKDDTWLDSKTADALTLDGDGYPKGFTLMDPSFWIKNSNYFGENFEPNEGEIHVLVVVPKVDQEQPEGRSLKKAKLTLSSVSQKDVAHQGPVSFHNFVVPMNTIEAYQKLETSFTCEDNISPLHLLYGPCQFGKTTIAFRLWDKLARDESVMVVYRSLGSDDVKTEESFWGALSSTTTIGNDACESSRDEYLHGKAACLARVSVLPRLSWHWKL